MTTAIPLPTTLDRYASETPTPDHVNVRMIYGTKVWSMTTEQMNHMLKTEDVEIVRIDGDYNVVVRYT